jgi:glucokinase
MFLGIEIGGTKLQLGVGRGDGVLLKLWRGSVKPECGGEGIRQQILQAVPQLLNDRGLSLADIRRIGVVRRATEADATQTVVKSHHIHGWDGFPLAAWLTDLLGKPTIISNDADVAGLAEAMHGAGRGYDPLFYITVGTGIGGGLIVNGTMYRGTGRGAAEIGHVRPAVPFDPPGEILEAYASGTGLGVRGSKALGRTVSGAEVSALAKQGDAVCRRILAEACEALAENICTVVKLLCPKRVIIGGGVSLIGEELFFGPIREAMARRGMTALAGLTDIVPAALGEEVVVHGAIALAKQSEPEA